MWLKDWRNRYFRLIGNQLHFSKTPEVRRLRAVHMQCLGAESEVDLQDAPHGVIDLSQCLTVKSANDKTGKSFSFEVATPDQVYFMCASDEATKDDWIGAIGGAIVRYSASYTKNAGPGPQVAIEQDDDVSSDED